MRPFISALALVINFFLGPILLTPAVEQVARVRTISTYQHSTLCTRQRGRGLGSHTIFFKFFFRKLSQCFNINHLHREM
ncbi:MAG: hypothetical protein ACK56F_04865, partial [bacterium]